MAGKNSPNVWKVFEEAVKKAVDEVWESGYQKGWDDCNDHNEKLRKWNDEHKE